MMPRRRRRPDRSLDEKTELIASMAVAARMLSGQGREEIRRGAVAVASKVITEEVADPYEQERLVAIVQRTVDRELDEGSRLRHADGRRVEGPG